MQPSEEAKRAIPNHEFYSPFVFLNNFYQFQKNITINRPFLSSISFLFVTDSFFMDFFDASVGKPALAPTAAKRQQMHERPPDIRRALGIRDLVYFA